MGALPGAISFAWPRSWLINGSPRWILPHATTANTVKDASLSTWEATNNQSTLFLLQNESKRERESQGGREGERERVTEKESQREREGERERERESHRERVREREGER